jgi:diguanylate cyclase (GGDEF)-like protein
MVNNVLLLIPLLAKILVLTGVLTLVMALIPVSKLIRTLPDATLRQRWYAMSALILFFIAGYLGYTVAFWNMQSHLLDLIVPCVFFFGALFVWLTGFLSLQTANDLIRINLLEQETVTDPLTGAFNRRYMDLRLAEEISRSQRYDLPLSVMLLDIDYFKQINDRFGHRSGDMVLVSISQIAAKVLRESDILVRYGGDEFLIITPHTNSPAAVEIANRICHSVASYYFDFPHDQSGEGDFKVTLSIGIADLGNGVDSKEKLIQAADKKLYQSKREGRNRVTGNTSGV